MNEAKWNIWQHLTEEGQLCFLTEYKVKSHRSHRGGAMVQAGVQNSGEAE